MSEIADRYRRLSGTFADRIDAVPADRWSSQSPCPEWSARELVGHVVSAQAMFLGFINEEMPPGPDAADDPAAAWAHASGVIQSALDDPTRAGTTFNGFFGESTFEAAVDRFLNFDLVVHGWDLARATGGDEHIDDADAQRVIESAGEFGDALRSPQVCGPEVSVSDDADLTARMLGIVGRTA